MIIDIKIGKAKEELSFLQSRHDELKLNYELTQKNLPILMIEIKVLELQFLKLI